MDEVIFCKKKENGMIGCEKMDKLEEMYQSFTNSITEDAENIISTDKSNAELQYSQTYNVHVPKPSDKIVLDASSVSKIKAICKEAKEVRFPYAELFLGLASLLFGGFLVQ